MNPNRGILIGLALLALTIVAVTGAALAIAGDGDDDYDYPVAAAPPAVAITARDFALDAPDAVPAGRVAFTLRNEGQEIHHAQFLRLNDGITPQQFVAALQQDPEAAAALGTDAGGPGAVSPGKSTTIIQDLSAGTYVMLCFISGDDGVPHIAKGMVRSFEVSGTAPPSAVPAADGEVVLGDFTILLPALSAGTTTLAVTNAGRQSHEVVVARLTDGATFADAEPFLQGRGAPPPLEAVGGTVGMAPGQRLWVTLDLPPGDYLALCFVTDPASGRPHVHLGMSATFTVR
jgi:hypothetical protein